MYSVARRGQSAAARLRVLVDVTLAFGAYVAHPPRGGDISRWIVCLGWNAAEKVSVAPNGRLNRVRNPVSSARAKAGLTGIPT